LRRGVELWRVSKILGHASIAITEHVYIHVIRQDVLGATDCLDN
jgi:integrase